jgi:tetratricopeptide (TPR) repeat protein
MIMIYEDTSLSKQKPGGSGNAKNSPLLQENRITIFHPDLIPGEQKGNLQEAAPGPENRSAVEATREAVPIPEKPGTVEAANDVPSADQGRSHITSSEFATAVDTFTQVIAAHPRDSLSYRMRGNAYDNLGDQQKALEDWTQAARLGDTIIQSYLDFLGVKWQENPAP